MAVAGILGQELLGVQPAWWEAGAKDYGVPMTPLLAMEFLVSGRALSTCLLRLGAVRQSAASSSTSLKWMAVLLAGKMSMVSVPAACPTAAAHFRRLCAG